MLLLIEFLIDGYYFNKLIKNTAKSLDLMLPLKIIYPNNYYSFIAAKHDKL